MFHLVNCKYTSIYFFYIHIFPIIFTSMRYNLILLSLLLLSFVASAQTDKAPTSIVAKPITSYQSIVGKDTSYYAYQNGVWFQLVGRAWLKSNYGPPSGYTGLTTTISGSNAITTAGSWFINGKPYSKTTTTTTAIAPITTSGQLREDILYADTLGGIHLQMGVTGSTSTPPDIPANTIPVANIYTSSTGSTSTPAGSGFVPYTGAVADLNLGQRRLTAGGLYTTGIGGTGGLIMTNQNTRPYTPNANNIFVTDYGNNFTIKKSDGFLRTISDANTADRSYTLPDKNGTVAMLSDIGGGGGPYVRQSQLFSLTTPNIIGDTVSQVTELYVDPLHNQFTIEGGTIDDNNAASIYGYDKGLVMQFQYGDRTKQIDMRNTSDSTIRVENDNNAGMSYFQKPNFALSTDHLMFASTGYADSVAMAHGGGGGSNITQSYFHSLTNNDVNMGDSVTNKAIVNTSPLNKSVTLSTSDPSGSSGVLLNEYNQIAMTQTDSLGHAQSIGMGEAYNDGIHVFDSQNNIYFKYNAQPSYINPSHDLMLATAHYADSLKAIIAIDTTHFVRKSQLYSLTTPNVIGDTTSGVTQVFVDPANNLTQIEGGTPDDNNSAGVTATDKGFLMIFQYGDYTKKIDMRNLSDSTIRVQNDNGAGMSYFQKPNFALSTDHLMFASTGYADSVANNTSVASSNLTAQTAANASVATYTTTSIGTFRIGGYVNITAVAVDVIEMQVTYTDENSNVLTVNFFNQGATSALLSATGNSTFPTIDIRCKSGTPITVKATLTTGSGTITYDTGAIITKLN